MPVSYNRVFCAFRDLLKLLSPLQPSAGVAVTTATAVGAIFVIIPFLYAVVKTTSLSFLVSSSAVLAAPTAKPSYFPGRTGFGGGRKENKEVTLPFINQWHLFFGLGSSPTGN